MKKYISVFFAGTAHPISSEFLAGYLFEHTSGDLLNQTVATNNTHFKAGFNGCGVNYGINGSLFATGLDEQCDHVISKINQFIAEGDEVVLNVYGHSRGGMAAILLAQQLSLVDPKKLEINLALMDPVPGNLIISANLDPFEATLANKGMDLTACKPLKNVLALYPYEPLPDIAFHAPLFVSYPENVEPEEVVVPGGHAGAEQMGSNDTIVTSSLVINFLSENGTKLNCRPIHPIQILQCYAEALEKLANHGPKERDTHSAEGIYIDAQKGAAYFNEHHRQLANGKPNARLAVGLKQSNNPLSLMKRTPFRSALAKAFAWTVFGLGLASLLFFMGVFAPIPIAASVTLSSALTIMLVTPILASASAFLWYNFIKPAGSWVFNRLLYPKYSIRENITENPDLMLEKIASTYGKISQELTPEDLDGSGIVREDLLDNKAVDEMIRTEETYNTALANLEKALNNDELVGKNQILLALRQPIHRLKLISDGLYGNAQKGIKEKLNTKERKDLQEERQYLIAKFYANIIEYAHLFKEYTDGCKANPDAFKKISAFLASGTTRVDLSGHLIMPIQRGPRYRLLIEEVKKQGTNLDHKNLAECEGMLKFIDGKLKEMNEAAGLNSAKTSKSKNDGCWPFWSSEEQPVKRATPAPTHVSKPF